MANDINLMGALPNGEKMSGHLATVFGKDGASAYEVAVKNGFEGTEEEWLLSLKGEKGDVGEKGEKGEQGEKGEKGDPGADGTMTFEELTPEQKASLKGDKGDKGDTGNSGVYIGSGEMPEDCYVQIDPNGDSFNIEDLIPANDVKVVSVEILANKWEGEASPYSQIVTVDGVTENSKVDLQPSVEQLSTFYYKDLAFVAENEDGVVTIYAIGDKPQNDYIIQATVTGVRK